jgi:hypothetical protein
MASGLALGRLAQAYSHIPMLARDTIGLVALAIPLFVAGFGVLRMRTWGVVLGTLAALASIPITLWLRDPILTAPMLLACAPAMLMPALVLLARDRAIVRHRVATSPQLRIADDLAETSEIEELPISTRAPTSPMQSSIACTRR